jgi:hypothetical protein
MGRPAGEVWRAPDSLAGQPAGECPGDSMFAPDRIAIASAIDRAVREVSASPRCASGARGLLRLGAAVR